MTNEQTAVKATYFSIASNTVLALIKGLAGFFGNSYALTADAIESTTDIFSSFLVLFGIKYSNKPADENHPYGHGRAEPLITFLVVGFLITSATIIANESIRNIGTAHELPKTWTLFVLGAIILWKEYSFRLVMKRSFESNSSFIGISMALTLGKGYETADDWAALFAAGFIFYNSYLIFRPALGEIMDEHLYDDLIFEIRKVSLQVKGIESTEKCFIRKAGMKYHVDLHAIVNANITVKEGHEISHVLKDTLRLEIPELGHVLIHIEPSSYN